MWLDLSSAVEHWGRFSPGQEAIITEKRCITYQELDSATECLAGIIRSNLGTSPTRIGIATESKSRFIAAVLACKRAGMYPVILNPHLDADDLVQTIADSGPSGFIVDSTCGSIQALAQDRTSCRLVGIDDRIWRPTDVRRLDVPPVEGIHDNDEWGVIFSSGSTGIPKAIVHSPLSMTSEILAWCLELELRRRSLFFVGRPLFYTGGLVLTCATLLVGGSSVFLDDEQHTALEDIWAFYQKACYEYRVEWAFFVPSQLRKLTELAHAKKIDCSSKAQTILTMGEPISGKQKCAARDALGSAIIESWGNSEGLGTITTAGDLETRPDSSGRPFLTERVFVVDDQLRPCPPNAVGRIAGPEHTMFKEYANRGEATARVKQSTLVLSEDLGYVDADGFLYVLGRVEQVMLAGDQTVIIPDVEDNIRKIRSVEDVAVISLTADDRAHLHLFLVRNVDYECSDSKVIIECRNELPPHISVAGVTFVEKIPRLAAGKIDRLRLQRMLEEVG